MDDRETRLGDATLARLRTLLDRTHDGILVIGIPEGRVVDVNASACRLTGLSRQRLLACNVEHVFGAEAWAKLVDLLGDGSTDPGILRTTHVELQREVGTVILELALGYHGFEDGLFGVVVMHDVTERERALRGFAAAHRRLRDVIEFLPDPTLVLDKTGRVVEWNRAMEALTGVDKAAIVGRGDFACSMAIHGNKKPLLAHRVLGLEPDERYPEEDEADQPVSSDNGVHVEMFARALRGGKGAHVWAAASPLRDADGNVVGAIESIRDRTDQRIAAEALRENERDVRATLNSIHDAVVATDASGNVRRMNPAAERLTGWTEARASGRPLRDVFTLLDGVTREPMTHPEFQVLRSRDDPTPSTDMLLVARDGTEHRVSARGAPILETDGTIKGIVVVIRDVTDQRLVERQLVLSQKMESIGRLASGVAHDFNNVLAAIRGYADVILDGGAVDESVREDLQEILDATDRARDLTRQLLAFGRHEPSDTKVVNVHAIIDGLQRMVARLIGEDIELGFALEAKQPCVLADPSQIEQVLMNLVVNARDAMPAGGSLTISTRDVDVEEQEGRPLDQVERRLRLSVRDTGIGMDPATQARVFEPFFTTKSPDRGTGIGLSTTYAVVRHLGGTISVRSATTVGTTFVIDLPACDCTATTSPAPSSKPSITAPRATVLVVEDEPVLRRLVSRILRKQGYEVISAGDGVEALDAASRFHGQIDLLVTDVVMPKMGGVALQKELRVARPGLRTLFVSGYSADGVIQGGLVADHPGFLAKPFTARRLIHKVTEVLGEAQPS